MASLLQTKRQVRPSILIVLVISSSCAQAKYKSAGKDTKCAQRGTHVFVDFPSQCRDKCDESPRCRAYDGRFQDGYDKRVFYCHLYFSHLTPFVDAATVANECYIKIGEGLGSPSAQTQTRAEEQSAKYPNCSSLHREVHRKDEMLRRKDWMLQQESSAQRSCQESNMLLKTQLQDTRMSNTRKVDNLRQLLEGKQEEIIHLRQQERALDQRIDSLRQKLEVEQLRNNVNEPGQETSNSLKLHLDDTTHEIKQREHRDQARSKHIDSLETLARLELLSCAALFLLVILLCTAGCSAALLKKVQMTTVAQSMDRLVEFTRLDERLQYQFSELKHMPETVKSYGADIQNANDAAKSSYKEDTMQLRLQMTNSMQEILQFLHKIQTEWEQKQHQACKEVTQVEQRIKADSKKLDVRGQNLTEITHFHEQILFQLEDLKTKHLKQMQETLECYRAEVQNAQDAAKSSSKADTMELRLHVTNSMQEIKQVLHTTQTEWERKQLEQFKVVKEVEQRVEADSKKADVLGQNMMEIMHSQQILLQLAGPKVKQQAAASQGIGLTKLRDAHIQNMNNSAHPSQACSDCASAAESSAGISEHLEAGGSFPQQQVPLMIHQSSIANFEWEQVSLPHMRSELDTSRTLPASSHHEPMMSALSNEQLQGPHLHKESQQVKSKFKDPVLQESSSSELHKAKSEAVELQGEYHPALSDIMFAKSEHETQLEKNKVSACLKAVHPLTPSMPRSEPDETYSVIDEYNHSFWAMTDIPASAYHGYQDEDSLHEAPLASDVTCFETKQAHVPSGSVSSIPSDSQTSSISLASWASAPASAPAVLSTARCFLPRTRFQRPSGEHVTAAGLIGRGGDIVLGPGGAHVMVMRAVKHHKQEKDFVRFRTEGGSHPFEVTADHRLVVVKPEGKKVDAVAQDLVATPNSFKIWNGLESQQILLAEAFIKSTEVIEVTFEADAVVLAWLLPEARPSGKKPRTLYPHACVACLGAPLQQEDMLVVRKTFIDTPSSSTSQYRSRSAGPSLSHRSWFSKGLGKHWKPCKTHLRHLLDPTFPPCEHGEECPRSHTPLNELWQKSR